METWQQTLLDRRITMTEILKKPKCKLIGKNGNAWNLMALAGKALKKAGQGDKVDEMVNKVTSGGSYAETLRTIAEYVDIY